MPPARPFDHPEAVAGRSQGVQRETIGACHPERVNDERRVAACH